MFDISERSERGEGGRWIDRWRFAPSSRNVPSSLSLPSSSKCVFTPIYLSGSFHESLRFPLDGRARLSTLTTHNRPTFSNRPLPAPRVVQRVPRRSSAERTNPSEDKIGNLKIARLLSLSPPFFFSSMLNVFFFFSIEISSSILFFDDFWIEKRII